MSDFDCSKMNDECLNIVFTPRTYIFYIIMIIMVIMIKSIQSVLNNT